MKYSDGVQFELVRLVALVAAFALGCGASAVQSSPPRTTPPTATEVAVTGPISIGEYYQDKGLRYVGGTVYVLIDVPATEVYALTESVEMWRNILPAVRDIRTAGNVGPDNLYELEQGTSVGSARYTVQVRRYKDKQGVYVARFWVNHDYPKDIDDAWCMLELRPQGETQTLLVYRVGIALSSGLIKWLFEEKIRRVALSTPIRLKGYAESRYFPAVNR